MPLWTQHTSGIAGRNGTTSHTIPFGWSAVGGELLVVLVGGQVTQAATGWNEPLAPVSSGELSVFWKAAAAGENSITVTHNGSNYPVAWDARSYAAGSAYVTGTSGSPSNDTFPTLSGLTGTTTIIAAKSRGNGDTSATATTTWTAPFVEEADQGVVFATTDGVYFTAASLEDQTAASVTPAASTTYTGSWGVPDRQLVVAAFTVLPSVPMATARPASTVAAGGWSAVGAASLHAATSDQSTSTHITATGV